MRSLLTLALAATLLACSGNNGTATGNPLVELRLAPYDATMTSQKAIQAMAIGSLQFCFKRLRFKQSGESTNPDPSTDSDNVELNLGEVTVSSLGTDLSGVHIPMGTYSRVEFDLDSECPSGKSIQLTNSNGSYSTSEDITIRFEGTFTRLNTGQVLGLNIQNIVSALNAVTSDAELASRAESVSGDF